MSVRAPCTPERISPVRAGRVTILARSVRSDAASLAAVVLAMSLAAACSSDPAAPLDAGSEPDAASASADATIAIAAPAEPTRVPPAAPAPATRPTLLPCPAGWSAVAIRSGTIERCEPWAAGAHLSCPEGQAHFPGEEGCRPIGAECTGDWPASLPADRPIVYVRAGATGGDGSIDAPYGSIVEGIRRARARSVIAVARGTYDEIVDVPTNIGVYGACTAETRVASSSPSSTGGTINIEGTGTEVRDLTISGRRIGLLSVITGSSSQLSGLLVDGASTYGIAVAAGRMSARSIVVRRTQGDASRSLGVGFLGSDGAITEISRALFEENRSFGLAFSQPRTIATLTGIAVLNTLPSERSRSQGFAIGAGDDAVVEVLESVIEEATESALVVEGDASRMTVRDTLIRGTRPDVMGGRGNGITALIGATALVERTSFADVHHAAIFSTRTASITAIDVLIERTTKTSTGSYGFGIGVSYGASFSAKRLHLEDNEEGGIGVRFAGSSAKLEDVSIDHGATWGGGIAVADQATLELRRASIINCAEYAIDVHDASATLEDLGVRGTVVFDTRGIGVWVSAGGQATLDRAAIEDSDYLGVHVTDPGSRLILNDARFAYLRQVDPNSLGGALTANEGGVINAQRVQIEDTQPHGVVSRAGGSVITLRDATIERVSALPSMFDAGGLVATAGGRVEAENLIIADSAGDAVISGAGVLEISKARFERSALVGALLYSTQATFTDVTFSDGGEEYGRGMSVFGSSTVAVTRAAFVNLRDAGIVASDPGTSIELEDVLILETESRSSDGAYGCAIDVQTGARMTIERARLLGNRSLSVLASDSAVLQAKHLEIRDGRVPACAPSSCIFDRALGIGVATALGARVDLEEFWISGCASAGILIGPGGMLSAKNGRIEHNRLGVSVQEPSFNRDVFEGVTFDNAINYDSATLPIPSAATPDLIPALP